MHFFILMFIFVSSAVYAENDAIDELIDNKALNELSPNTVIEMQIENLTLTESSQYNAIEQLNENDNLSQISQKNAIDERMKNEALSELSKFSIIPHKPNYILPLNFNDKIQDYDIYKNENGNSTSQRVEMKFQVSFKMPLFHHIGDLPISGYAAYTQVSFWQAYNTAYSSPFRETNYEPEAFLLWETDKSLGLGWRFKSATLGFTHQSNGRSEPLSRSWNRINTSFVFDRHNLVVAVNPWYRFEDSDDDNPDLLEYYGHGEVTLAYKHKQNVLAFTSRNNLESAFSKGSVKATWSFPIYGKVKGYMEVFSGYGNSLVEYDEYTNTFGLGISIADLL